jgi:hypothetical protein
MLAMKAEFSGAKRKSHIICDMKRGFCVRSSSMQHIFVIVGACHCYVPVENSSPYTVTSPEQEKTSFVQPISLKSSPLNNRRHLTNAEIWDELSIDAVMGMTRID